MPFRRIYIDEIDDNAGGVYGFWYKRKCLYIGKAKPVKERLMAYWNGRSHNQYLQMWIDVYRKDIKIAYKVIDDSNARHHTERLYISRFSPETNKTN